MTLLKVIFVGVLFSLAAQADVKPKVEKYCGVYDSQTLVIKRGKEGTIEPKLAEKISLQIMSADAGEHPCVCLSGVLSGSGQERSFESVSNVKATHDDNQSCSETRERTSDLGND